MKYFESTENDEREAERTNQNFAMLFEENVLRSIGEIDKALLYLRRTVETRKASDDYHSIHSIVQSSGRAERDHRPGRDRRRQGHHPLVQCPHRVRAGDQRRRPRAHQGPAQQHGGPSLHQQAGDRPRQRSMVGAVHAALPEQGRHHRRRRRGLAQSGSLHHVLRQDRSRIVRRDLHDRQRRRGPRIGRQRGRPLCARPGHQRHQAGAAHAGRRRRDLRRRGSHAPAKPAWSPSARSAAIRCG